MKFIATIINALAVQRQAEGASHSANTLTSGYKQRNGIILNGEWAVITLRMQGINSHTVIVQKIIDFFC